MSEEGRGREEGGGGGEDGGPWWDGGVGNALGNVSATASGNAVSGAEGGNLGSLTTCCPFRSVILSSREEADDDDDNDADDGADDDRVASLSSPTLGEREIV